MEKTADHGCTDPRGHWRRGVAFFAASLVVLAILLPTNVLAEPLELFGKVGDAPVFMSLERDGSALSGWYYYIRRGIGIRLAGTMDADRFALDAFGADNGGKTGEFTGTSNAADWSGIWRSPNGRQLAFSLQHPGTLADLNGQFRCKTSFTALGNVFAYKLELSATHGRITQFALSHEATPADAACSVAMSDLTQIAGSGIRLRAKEDDDSDTSERALHCSFNLVGDADYLVIHVNGCRGAGDTRFCSARGDFTDLILNRKTQACTALQ